MNCLVLEEEDVTALEALNGSAPTDRKLEPVTLTDERVVLNADLLQDCADGEGETPAGTWNHYKALLESLPVEEIDPELFPE